jgi:hypothetical protein
VTVLSHAVLLGPQRLEPTLRAAIESLGVAGRIAAVTAGWEEREGEDRELSDHLGGRTVNLRLFERGEEAFRADPDLFGAVRALHDRLRKVQELYRVRLAHLMQAARELTARLGANGDAPEAAAELAGAIDMLRQLDLEHVARAAEVHADFEARVRPHERSAVARHRAELKSILDGCDALAIAGGHVAVLLNRLRLFGVLELWGDRPLVAWSAGSMVIEERIVVFHDRPPQGAGDPEVLEAGLGACPGLIALPHATRRLDLDDTSRVALFARRFAPSICVAFDPRARVDWRGGRWSGRDGTRALRADGGLAEVPA